MTMHTDKEDQRKTIPSSVMKKNENWRDFKSAAGFPESLWILME
jgi:hypothetical protein